MKKLIVFLIVVCFAGALSAQNKNDFKYVINAKGGIVNTLKSAAADKVDSIKVSSSTIWFFQGADTLKIGLSDAGSLNLSEYAVMLLPDSLHISAAADTLDATWAGRDIFVYSADSIRIVIPSGLTGMPVGTTVNVFQMGAAKIRFKLRGVRGVSPLDSLATSKKGDVVGIKKIAANVYMFYGNLTD